MIHQRKNPTVVSSGASKKKILAIAGIQTRDLQNQFQGFLLPLRQPLVTSKLVATPLGHLGNCRLAIWDIPAHPEHLNPGTRYCAHLNSYVT